MDFDFSPVTIPQEARRKYRVPQLGVELELTSLTESNHAYHADFVKMVAAVAAGGMLDDKIDAESAARGRRRDAPLIARHGIRGWSGVKTSAGEPVPFTPAAAEEWLLALARHPGAEHVFDGIRSYCKTPDNFTNSAIGAAAVLAGNSSGG